MAAIIFMQKLKTLPEYLYRSMATLP